MKSTDNGRKNRPPDLHPVNGKRNTGSHTHTKKKMKDHMRKCIYVAGIDEILEIAESNEQGELGGCIRLFTVVWCNISIHS